MYLLAAIFAFLMSTLLVYRFARPDSKLYLLDYPNERSLHSKPVPRGGGVAIALSAGCIMAGLLVIKNEHGPLMWIMASGGLIAGASYFDDRHGLTPLLRLIVHAMAASLLLYAGLWLDKLSLPGFQLQWPAILGLGFSFVFIVWMVNLYNFMDGMDGFAGGMALSGFGCMALLGWWEGAELFAATNLVIAASVGGFLVFNYPPARIFMGDSGSSLLGFLGAGMGLWADRAGIFPVWVMMLIFSLFIVDATVTLIRRLLRGERVWEAHRTHYYQRLVRHGWSHRRTVLSAYVLMLSCAASAVAVVGASTIGQWVVLAGWFIFYVAAMLAIDKIIHKGTIPA